MTPQEQKELAEFGTEFGAEFLGFQKIGGVWFSNHPDPLNRIQGSEYEFFHWMITAPILAHLAKREMEKRGFTWELTWWVNEDDTKKGYGAEFMHLVNAPVHIGKYDMSMPKQSGYAENENEYIALWLAIREAVKG